VLAPLQAGLTWDVWDEQIRKHFPLTAHVETTDEEWTIKPTGVEPTIAVDFYLLNYEKVSQRKKVGRGSRKKWHYPYVAEVENWGPDIVVCDESHRLKRAGGVAAQATWRMVRRLRKRSPSGRPYVFELTGTPAPKGWIDIFAQYRVMNDEVFGTDKASFEQEYVEYGQGPRKYTILRYHNEKRLLRKIHEHSYTCTAEQAGLAGEQFWQKLWVTLPPKVRKTYDEMAEEFITQLEGGEYVSASNPAVKRLRLLQITGGFTTEGVEIHREKLSKATGWAENLFEQGESVIVYCRYLPEVFAVAEAFEGVGYRTDAIHGGNSSGRRAAVRSFQRTPASKCAALVFQVQTGSMAIELSRAAEMLIYSPPDGWENYWQCLLRVMGINQKRPVRYTHILAHNTMDLPVMEGLVQKEDWHRTLLKDPRRFLGGMIQ